MNRLCPKTLRGRIVLGLLLILLLPYVFSRVASRYRYVRVYSTETTISTAPPLRNHLRIGCYNIAHGRGVAESNWAGGTAQERIARLDQIAALLRKSDADVVVLNEVDFDCSWSNSVDQARYLAKKADYSYCAEQRNVDFRILLWKWKFGNAVLSKYPITDARAIHLPGISRIESIFGGKKRAIRCEITTAVEKIGLIGAHLSHQSEAVRVASAAVLVDIAKDSRLPTIIAGDLNSTPPNLPEFKVDSAGRNAIQTFDDSDYFRRYLPTTPLPAQDCTFHSVRPKMTIDWILIPMNWRHLQYSVTASELSDHRPVFSHIARNEDL